MEDCIFCRIIRGGIPSKKVFENKQIVAFNDISPKAKVHILVVPKEHIESARELKESHKELMGELILTARQIAQERSLKGYKLIINVGREGGQLINHLHIHLLSGDVASGI